MEKKHIPKEKATNKSKLLISFLGIEFLIFLITIISANKLIPMDNSRLIVLGIISTLMLVTGYFLYTENKAFYKKHKKKFNIIFTILLILIPMLFAGYIRSYTYDLPMADEWAENSVISRITPQIYQQVKTEFPNLPENLINAEVQKRQDEFVQENYEAIMAEKEKVADSLRDKFQGENGQTYFLAIDPYYYYTYSKSYSENGFVGDDLIDDEPVLTRRLAPVGVKTTNVDFHTWLESKIYAANNLDATSTPAERTKSVYFLPVLFSMLAIIPLFLIIKLYSNNLFAFLGSLSFATVSTFLSRTMAGFVDTDAYNVFFPLLIIFLVCYSLNSKDKKTTSVLAILAGIVQTIYLWAWGSGWFAFFFVLIALIGYIAYTFLAELIEKNKLKQITKRLHTEFLVLGAFLLSAIVSSAIVGKNILSTTFKALINSSSGLTTAKLGNIWPNVYSSVAELNSASFSSIINSVGGKLVFFIALIGLLLLSLDFTNKHEKYKLYKNILLAGSLVWFSFFVVNFKDMGLLETISNNLIGLTSNSPLTFVILLFLPIAIGMLFSLHNTNADKKTFLTILIAIYMAGTIYMSFQGVRFILLLAPAFIVAVSIGLFYLAKLGNTEIPKLLDLKNIKLVGTILVLVLFLFMFVPTVTVANQIATNAVPNFDDNWYDLMYKIRDNSNEDAIITSWWDFGHFFIAISERGATFDGASQTTPRSHWVGKLLMENDEDKAVDILRMLTCGGNEAFNLMLEQSGDETGGVFVNKIIYSTLGEENKREILENNPYFTFTDVDSIIEKLACNNPPENFVITSEDMVSKAGVWAHWGSWDFTRKYILDNYKSLSAEEITNNLDEDFDNVNRLVSQLKEIDLKSNLKNIKREDLINQWLAPYPSYLSADNAWLSCNKEGTMLNCQNTIKVDLTTKTASFFQKQDAEIYKLTFLENGNLTSNLQDENGLYDLVIRENAGSYYLMITQAPLGSSTFTKLFYLDGAGTEKFVKFDERSATNGWKIYTWKVDWSYINS